MYKSHQHQVGRVGTGVVGACLHDRRHRRLLGELIRKDGRSPLHHRVRVAHDRGIGQPIFAHIRTGKHKMEEKSHGRPTRTKTDGFR